MTPKGDVRTNDLVAEWRVVHADPKRDPRLPATVYSTSEHESDVMEDLAYLRDEEGRDAWIEKRLRTPWQRVSR